MLENILIKDIKPEIITKNNPPFKKVIFDTFDGLVVNINIHKIDDNIYYHFDIISDSMVRKELDDSAPNIVGLPDMKTFDAVKIEESKYNHLKKWIFGVNIEFDTDIDISLNDIIEKTKVNN